MKKVKGDLLKRKMPIKTRKVENEKGPKVQDLAPKAKNLAENLKKESAGMKKSRKAGEVSRMEIDPRLKKLKSKK